VIEHASAQELEGGLDDVRRAPKDLGRLELIGRRPCPGEREVLEEGRLDPETGLDGDGWSSRGRRRPPNVDAQLTLMSARVAALVARTRDRWPLAGDQLYVDLDLSEANVPAGTRLAVGSALIEITPPPHTGCKKFVQRFGLDAMLFVNSPEGRRLRLRGVNARVVRAGTIAVGDRLRKLPQEPMPL
jgi:MOSC domain-containing protein YiiM